MIVGLVIGGLAIGKAQAGNNNATSPVVDKLVERFNLNQDEVAGVFDEVHQERQQQWLDAMGERLDKAVSDGVITTNQKRALLNKQAEMQEKRNQLREEMKTWMEESGIDFEKLTPYSAGCGGRGFGKMRGFGGW